MNGGETFSEADERARYEAATHGDLTITMTHRAALRRIDRREPLAGWTHIIHELVQAGLADDNHIGHVWLTESGRALLAAHDRLVETRRTERPRLEPRRLPPGWRIDLASSRYVHRDHGPFWDLETLNNPDQLAHFLRVASDTLELLRWVEHSLAVEAQDTGAPRGRIGGSEHEAPHPSAPRLGMGERNSGPGSAGGVTAPADPVLSEDGGW